MTLLAIPFGLAIGLVVGTVGGGGAILALPVVYILDEPVNPASTASLIVVALAAAVGAGAQRGHHVCLRLAITFSIPAAAGSLLGTIANKQVSGPALILAFVPIMALAGVATWQRACSDTVGEDLACPTVPTPKLLVAGSLVGTLTGFFGVGGGFVIVPVLTLWFGMSFRRAVGTSLVIITLTGGAALASNLITGTTLDLPVTAALAGATMVGALGGSLVGSRLPQKALGQGFALVVGAVALFLLIDTLAFHGPPGS